MLATVILTEYAYPLRIKEKKKISYSVQRQKFIYHKEINENQEKTGKLN